MFATVPGVTAAPPTSGLVAAAVRPDPTDPAWAKWELGIAFVSERCGAPYQLAPWCADTTTDPATSGYDPQRAGAVYYRPVEARFADECSTLGGAVDFERVRRVADATTPHAVARELWSGAGTLADPHDLPGGGTGTNAYLASPDAETVGSGELAPRVGLGLLEQAAMEASRGQQVYLHVPLAVLPQLDGSFRAVGSQLITWAGNVLVADGAYPGDGPNGEPVGSTVWAYATSPVVVLTSDLEVERNDTARVDRATNTRTTWATRLIAAVFDPCVHLTAQLSLAAPTNV